MRHAEQSEIQFCVDLYLLGTPMKILAWMTGRPPQTIARWLRAAGARRRRSAR